MSESSRAPVVVLNWNGWDDTFNCLRSLRSARGVSDVWVIDNGSDDDRTHEVGEHFPGAKTLRLGENFGWAGGYNRALDILREQGYEYAYLLNNDTEVHPEFFAEVLSAYHSMDSLGSVGSVIRYFDGSVKFDGDYHRPGATNYQPSSEVRRVSVTNGSGMLVDFKAFTDVGGFDERFFCYGEETDWCARATKAGYQNYLAGRSVIWHRSEGSDVNSNAAYYRARNLYLRSSKRGGTVSRFMDFVAITRSLYRHANGARRAGDQRQLDALLQAGVDGLRGRFGKRTSWKSPWWLRAVAYTWPFPTGVHERETSQ